MTRTVKICGIYINVEKIISYTVNEASLEVKLEGSKEYSFNFSTNEVCNDACRKLTRYINFGGGWYNE